MLFIQTSFRLLVLAVLIAGMALSAARTMPCTAEKGCLLPQFASACGEVDCLPMGAACHAACQATAAANAAVVAVPRLQLVDLVIASERGMGTEFPPATPPPRRIVFPA